MDLDVIRSANDDPEFRMAARFWNAVLCLGPRDARATIDVTDGRITDVGPGDRSPTIGISGPDDGWSALLAATPRPFYQDLWGAISHHGFAVEGDFEGFCQYYPAVRRLIEILRS